MAMAQPAWTCSSCTYSNHPNAQACQMCNQPNQMGAPMAYNQQYAQQPQQFAQQAQYQPQYAQPQHGAAPMQMQPQQQAPPPAYDSTPDMGLKQTGGGGEGVHSSMLPDGKNIDYSTSKYRDKFWAVFFIIHLLVIVAVLVIFRDNLELAQQDLDNNAPTDEPVDTLPIEIDVTWSVIIIAAAAAIGFVWAVVWISVMKRYAESIIKITFGLVVILHIAMAGFLVLYSSLTGAIIALVVLGLFLLYAYFARKRIPFAGVMLEMASQCIQDHYASVYVAMGMSIVSLAWSVIWILTIIVVSYQAPDSEALVVFLLLISFYWTAEVLSNIVHVTAAGVAATWYFAPETKNPTSGAFKRATTTSFGSICFGSFVIAVVRAIRQMLNIAREQSNDNALIICCVDCILGCLESILEYLNLYAYAQVAIYGKDFWTAAKDTFQLFKSKGFDAIVNDDLTGFVLLLGAFIGGLAAGIIGGLWASGIDTIDTTFSIILGVLSFFVAFFFVSLIMAVVRSYITTFFVCFAEDPQALTQTHPTTYQKVVAAIEKMHGHAYDNQFRRQA